MKRNPSVVRSIRYFILLTLAGSLGVIPGSPELSGKSFFSLPENASGTLEKEALNDSIGVYPVPSCYSVNSEYTMQVTPNGAAGPVEVPLIDHLPRGVLNVTYGNFFFRDTVIVEITKPGSIGTYSIRPKSRNLQGTLDGGTLSFTLTSPEYLMITIDGTDLLVFAEEFPAGTPPSSGPGIFNVAAAPYNADNTGATIVTDAIQQAFDDASAYAEGTGIVYVPAGVYSITRLNAGSNLEVFLAGGAVLRGTGNPEDYDEYVPGGGTDYTYCIHAENQENIKVWGPGTIDANGVSLTGLTSPDTQPPDISDAIMKIRALSIHNCSQVTVSDIIAREGSSWTVSLYDCDNVDVHRTKVVNERVLKHNDGIDLNACQHGRVQDCFILTSDDALCAKGTNDNQEDCYDLRFEHIVIYSNTRGVKCGMQAYRHMYDIWFRDIDVLNARYGIDLLHQDGTGLWEDIHFIDIRVEDLEYFVPSSPAPIQASVHEGGPIQNVEITNCTFEEWGDKNSKIQGHISGPIRNVIFTNLEIAGELIHNAVEAHMDTNPYTENILFRVGDFDTIIFPPLDTVEIEEECFSFEPEDYSWQDLFAPFVTFEDPGACQGEYIECDETVNEPTDEGRVIYEFNVKERAYFVAWFRVIADNAMDDSFWILLDGELHKFNEMQQSTDWIWDRVKDSDTDTDPLLFDLQPGNHTLEILRRESHTKLDKVYITNQVTVTPEGCEACATTGISADRVSRRFFFGNIVTENPAGQYLELLPTLDYPGVLRMYDLQGRLVRVHKVTGSARLDVSSLENGLYLVEYAAGSFHMGQKVFLN